MGKKKLNRIIRPATSAEKRRHKGIRAKTDEEFARRRKPVSASRAILVKLRSHRELKGLSLADVAERTGIPVAETFAGKGSLRYDHSQALGAMGVSGTHGANIIARAADLVIVIGSRLSE